MTPIKISVFDDDGKVCFIEWTDVIGMRRVDRRMNYVTKNQTYYGAITMKEEGSLHESLGFIQIDKNCVININHVDEVVKGKILIHGKLCQVSRRKLATIKKFIKARKKDTNFDT